MTVPRTAPALVTIALIACAGCVAVSLLISPILLDPFGAANLSARIREHVPGWAYNLLVRGLVSAAAGCFLLAMTVSLIAGPRRLRAGLRRPGMALTGCGLVLAIVYCVGPMLWYARTRNVLNEVSAAMNAQRAELRALLESGAIADGDRERMWKVYASGLYIDEGIVARFSDASGRTLTWKPTEADIAARRTSLEMRERLETPTGQVKGTAIWVAVCLGIGLLWPFRRAGGAGPFPPAAGLEAPGPTIPEPGLPGGSRLDPNRS